MDGSLPVCPSIQRPDRVRVAGPADSDRIYDLLMVAAAENAMAPVYEARVREKIRRAVEREGSVIGVIDGTTSLAGSIGMDFDQWWYSNEWHVCELWNFVHPDYRKGSGHAAALIDFAKWWSQEMGMPLLMGVISYKQTEAKVRLYRRKIPFVGALFLHRPNLPVHS